MDMPPLREDGTLDLTEAARLSLERMVNEIMDAQADELCGEGNRRNGYRERGLMTMVGEITLRIPKLREGTYFPDELVRPYSRVDRSVVAAVRGVYARGLSTRAWRAYPTRGRRSKRRRRLSPAGRRRAPMPAARC